jgi:hypothetical protein
MVNSFFIPFSAFRYYHWSSYLVYYIFWLPSYLLSIYYAYVIFSFTKEFGLGNMETVDGQQTIIVATQYQNISGQGGYVPNINVTTTTVNQGQNPQYGQVGNQGYVQPQQGNQGGYQAPQPYQGNNQPVQGGNQGYNYNNANNQA